MLFVLIRMLQILACNKSRFVFMCSNVFFHLTKEEWRDIRVTVQLKLLQFLDIFNARQRLQCDEGQDNLLKVRSTSILEADVFYLGAVDTEKVELWEVSFVEGIR
ncbi:hypothetical protein BS78_05G198100 [Paspalum vaginatum]|nr:hypothetical protein BS78_05G198100 [Paspalum vaginatum]KAJ1276223.1 hypothetical protein BS78_05G198100 [Paspalum vaginatum]